MRSLSICNAGQEGFLDICFELGVGSDIDVGQGEKGAFIVTVARDVRDRGDLSRRNKFLRGVGQEDTIGPGKPRQVQ